MSRRRSPFRKSLWATALFLSCLLAQADEIAEIRFEQKCKPENTLPDANLRFNLKSKIGQELDNQTVTDDIKRLMATGFVDDVQSSTEIKNGKISLTFIVTPKPLISKLRIEGNQKFDTKDLMEMVKLQPQTPLNETRLNETCTAIRNHYEANGYNDISVMPNITREEDGQVIVVIRIDEGLRLKINNVAFEGNEVFSTFKLQNQIANRHSYFSWILDIGLYQESQMDADKLRLRELYLTEGYLDFEVKEARVEADPDDPEYVNITFVIDEGEPYSLSSINVSGSTQVIPADLEALLKLQKGDRYNQAIERKDADALSSQYYRLGYDDVEVEPILTPNVNDHTVSIEYRIKEGTPSFVRGINIRGNTYTKDYVLRREVTIVPGDPYDRNKLEQTKKRLNALGYIEDVNAVAFKTENPELRDLDIAIKEKDFMEARVGGGISDTDSLAGMIMLRHKNFDITGLPDENSDLSDPNSWFTGAGQTLSAAAVIGIEIINFDIHFSEPWLFNRPYRLDVNGYFHTRSYPEFSERHAGGETSISRRLSFLDEYTSLTLGYKIEAATILDVDKGMAQMFHDEAFTSIVSQPSLTLSHITTDNRMDPTSGHELVLFGQITPNFLGSTYNYAKFELKAMQHFAFWEDLIRAHIGGKIGMAPTLDGSGHVPLYDRYFLGGGDSLRGFPFRSVGPVNRQHQNFGGQSMYIVTGEVSHPIYSVVRGAVFSDVGGSWASSTGWNFKETNIGAGYGLRINVPGIDYPIRLDLAYPLRSTTPGLEKKIRFHFDVGFTW